MTYKFGYITHEYKSRNKMLLVTANIIPSAENHANTQLINERRKMPMLTGREKEKGRRTLKVDALKLDALKLDAQGRL